MRSDVARGRRRTGRLVVAVALLGLVLSIALVRAFVAHPVRVASASMLPTFAAGG